MPRVSVILPNYNYARYLKERVRSILNQTMPNFELLYLDDASTDHSNMVMRQFASDHRVQMHCFETNSGQVYKRWNDGARLASGEWLWFAGADDAAHPRFLERLLALADASPNIGIVHCATARINGDGGLVGLGPSWVPFSNTRLSTDHVVPGYSELPTLSIWPYLFTASSILLRRKLFENAGGWDSRLWITADWDLYLTMLQNCDIAYTQDILSYYRVHGGTVTNRAKNMVRFIENSYCQARVYQYMKADRRIADEDCEETLRWLKLQIFNAFTEPFARPPAELEFAARKIYEVVPDKRLLHAS